MINGTSKQAIKKSAIPVTNLLLQVVFAALKGEFWGGQTGREKR
jgi:hypothetical protein